MHGVNWGGVELVVFDVDGTLYDQQRVRIAMAVELASEMAWRRNFALAKTLRAYRRCHEELGEGSPRDLRHPHYSLSLQRDLTAQRTGQPVEQVHAWADEWMEKRPLPHIAAARVDGVRELFAALAASGRTIAIFSDYPAEAKLAALGLVAHIVVTAGDSDVGRLKPDPAGLRKALSLAGVRPERALMIGDRFDRDALAAQRAAVPALIRSRRSAAPYQTFRNYRDAVFRPILSNGCEPLQRTEMVDA